MNPRHSICLLGFTGAVLMGACGGDEDTVVAVLGIYQVSSHTENTAGCDAEGAAVRQTSPFFFVRKDKLLDYPYYNLMGCKSLTDCRTAAKDPMHFEQLNFIFHTPKSPTTLTGSTRFTGFKDGKTCTKPSVSEHSFVRTGDDVRIESRTRVGDDYPADNEGFCSTSLGERASRGKPCAELVVVTAKFVEPLPQ